MALVSVLHCSALQEAAAHLRQTARSPSGARSRKQAKQKSHINVIYWIAAGILPLTHASCHGFEGTCAIGQDQRPPWLCAFTLCPARPKQSKDKARCIKGEAKSSLAELEAAQALQGRVTT